ncbi:hypothetical protein K432DRAFT_294167 [Lepidopterella palustris CBS 459.81]|uniref:Rhodopsin domain-containing protein n=1 Tax=Lepidopterella palustris CBS 459.81 TaxID=1314670 RepID=A0A8E2JH01_9PEZI|nr:hypothetical protein K432DRAFT_294167 [Lepidopterella palustris CBS 459.81]
MVPHDNAALATRGQQEKAVAIAFLVATWIFVLLRVLVRTYVIRNFGWDDATMVLANILFTFYCISVLVVEAHGGGTHLTDINEVSKVINWNIAAEDFYIATICFMKVSFGIFFQRIIAKPWHRNLIYIIVAVSTVQSLANFFFIIFRCGPHPGHYLTMQLEGKCASRSVNLLFLYMHAAVTTVTDWIFALLPVFILWDSKMDIRTKISVGFILSLGAVGSICSIIRFRYIDGLTRTDDFFWNATNCAIWSTIEPGTGIIAGSLATMRPFFRLIFRTARDLTTSASHSTFVKRVSRSFRSGPNSSAQQSIGTKDGLKPRSKSGERTRMTATCVSKDGKFVELRETNFIIMQNDDGDVPWPFQHHDRGKLVTHDVESDSGIETDRQSSHTLGEEEGRDVRLSLHLPPVASAEHNHEHDDDTQPEHDDDTQPEHQCEWQVGQAM